MSSQDLRRIYKARSFIFHEGEQGHEAYLIRKGSVAIVKKTDQGQVPLATVGKNMLFGEMALIDGSPRMASAVTTEDTILSIIDRAQLTEKLGRLLPEPRNQFTLLLNYVRETLPWEKRRENFQLSAETTRDTNIRAFLPQPGAGIPAEFMADPFLTALYRVTIEYVRRRLPVAAAPPTTPLGG